MKIFLVSFVIIFSLVLGSIQVFEYYRQAELNQEMLDRAQDAVRMKAEEAKAEKAVAEDDFGLPDNSTIKSDPLKEKAAPASEFPARTATASLARYKFKTGSGSQLMLLPGTVVPQNLEAAKDLSARNYSFTPEHFLKAIANDDYVAVNLFLKAKMPVEMHIEYTWQPASDSPYLFYASQPTMLYNPLSLAIVAGARKSLPLLLAGVEKPSTLQALNQFTPGDRIQGRNGYDLLGLALQTADIDLLRTLIAAGLKPRKQGYLPVAFFSKQKEDAAGQSPEAARQIMRRKADLLVELINNGQNPEQGLPFPIMGPRIMQMFFIIAGPELSAELIARITIQKVKMQLQTLSSEVEKSRKRK